MSEAIKLTSEELAIIEERRAKEAEAEAKREAERKAREEKAARIKAAHEAKVKELRDNLFASDEHGLLFEDDKGVIRFHLGDMTPDVEIVEHVVSGSGYLSRGRSKGYKYMLSGSFNEYKRTYYKNPLRLLSRIREFQTINEARRKAAEHKASLKDEAMNILSNKYSNAEVTFEGGYETHRGRQPDRIVVKSDRGSVTFTYYRKDEGVTFNVLKRTISDLALSEKVNDLILG